MVVGSMGPSSLIIIALVLLSVSIPTIYAAAFPGHPPPHPPPPPSSTEMNVNTTTTEQQQLFVRRIIPQPEPRRRHRTVKRSEVVSSGACTASSDGKARFPCPLSRDQNVCIEDRQLCNGRYDCPRQEDENPVTCFFYKFITSHINSAIRNLGSSSSNDDASSTAT